MLDETTFLRRALMLAARGRGFVEPNPLVGCVLVRHGQMIGEGYHEKFGGPHAEINALAACHQSPAGATAYVTLEPCCHTGKKTPPCVPRLIEAKLARVVIGCLDANPQVSGQGAAQLRAAGIDVLTGVLEAECLQINAAYIARIVHKRPYVTLKWAVSADGKIAARASAAEAQLTPQTGRVQISTAAATAVVHALRGRCDAIAIGTNTLISDDPLLTARTPHPPRVPVRVVFSNRLSFPMERRLFATLEAGPVLIYTAAPPDAPKARGLRERGVEVISLPARPNDRGESRFSMNDAYENLHARGVTHLLVEPGAKLARELIARNQADRAWIIQGRVTIGEDGIEAPNCPWPMSGGADLEGDQLREHLNPRSEVFFTTAESADLVIARGGRTTEAQGPQRSQRSA